MAAVPIKMAATSKTPLRTSQSTGPRRIDAGICCGPTAAVRGIASAPHMLERDFRIPLLSGDMLTMHMWHTG
jgi:hypothetical protein